MGVFEAQAITGEEDKGGDAKAHKLVEGDDGNMPGTGVAAIGEEGETVDGKDS